MKIFLICKFRLSYLARQHPVLFPVLFLLTLSMCGAVGACGYWAQRQHALEGAISASKLIPRHPVVNAAPTPSVESLILPVFSPAEFSDKFQSLIKDVGLPVDEIVYSLETGKAEPYWRYRITLKVQAGYPAIRRLLAALSSEFPNVLLDGIRCQRENSAAANVKCELSLSGLFRRNEHG